MIPQKWPNLRNAAFLAVIGEWGSIYAGFRPSEVSHRLKNEKARVAAFLQRELYAYMNELARFCGLPTGLP